MGSREIFALRRGGKAPEALELARTEYSDHSSDVWFLRAYGWVLYDVANKAVAAFESKSISAVTLARQLSPCLQEFAKFGDALRGDGTFSQMVRLATKVSKDLPDFLAFARWAGVDSFSEDDRTPFVNREGKTLDSLERRFMRAICREAVSLAGESHPANQLVGWGLGMLERALEGQPGDQWLNYYQSKLHLSRGEAELAVRRLAPVLRRQPRAAWTWALLGEILEGTRPSDALTCFGFATQLAREEVEVAKTRIRLARHLAACGRYAESAHQVWLALDYRERKGFRVPDELSRLLSSDWYRQAQGSSSGPNLPDQSGAARALLKELDQKSLTYTTGVIDHINLARSLSYVATSLQDGIALTHRQFPDVAALVPGTVVEVGRVESDGRALDWRISQLKEIAGLCEVRSGRLTRPLDRDFAFVGANGDRVFVPPPLARDFAPGEASEVRCVAIRRADHNGRVGWRAVSFFPDEPASAGLREAPSDAESLRHFHTAEP
ncbi:hypothetical protein GCM10022280_18670 [Sphingomonas swuensis]|uniref:TOTE conflict systems S1/CSD-like domain-containing protein n=1 Tax=Sphingomonas swuensis TaxID=977800 RepID=A0ABP7T133_9SPHN